MSSRIDVIIPSYNPNPEYLKKALDSVFAQVYKDFWITIVDDNSDIPVEETLSKIGYDVDNPFITCIRNDKNLGPSGTRNVGIGNTSGELISFLDDDDVWTPIKLAISMLEFKDEQVGMTCGNYRIQVNNRRPRPPFYKRHINIDHAALMRINYVASGSTTIRRNVLKEIRGPDGFDERYWIAEDYDLWVRISEKYKIKYIHDVLYHYRVIPGGDSLTQRHNIQDKHIANIEQIKRESIRAIK